MAVEITVSPLTSVNPQKELLRTQSWTEIGRVGRIFLVHVSHSALAIQFLHTVEREFKMK